MSTHEKFSKQPPVTTRSTLEVPPLSCDCHGHIFPAANLYPTTNETMPLAPVEVYLDIHRQLGFGRGALVQGGSYKFDNSAMLEALDRHPATLRGVALVPPDAGDATLADLRARNIRALRFTRSGASRFADFPVIAPRMRAHGLHAEMFIGFEALVEHADALLGTGVPIVLDHLAGPFEASGGIEAPAFRAFLDLLRTADIWVKLSPQRNSAEFPGYGDVRPHFDAMVAARQDRMVWGSDWPFPNMSDATPDIGDLLTLFGDWISDQSLRDRILVDNPARLYGFG